MEKVIMAGKGIKKVLIAILVMLVTPRSLPISTNKETYGYP